MRLGDIGIQVRAIVSDGTTANIATSELLGARLPARFLNIFIKRLCSTVLV